MPTGIFNWNKRNILLFLFIIALFSIVGCSSTTVLPDGHKATSEHDNEHADEVHLHAAFMVYINDEQIDFSLPIYQLKDQAVHLEDGIGDIIHVHDKGITMDFFFETLKVKFNRTCISIPIHGPFCNTDDQKLSFYVNNKSNYEFENYEIRELDRILITYGTGDIDKQLENANQITMGI